MISQQKRCFFFHLEGNNGIGHIFWAVWQCACQIENDSWKLEAKISFFFTILSFSTPSVHSARPLTSTAVSTSIAIVNQFISAPLCLSLRASCLQHSTFIIIPSQFILFPLHRVYYYVPAACSILPLLPCDSIYFRSAVSVICIQLLHSTLLFKRHLHLLSMAPQLAVNLFTRLFG